jgi:membrane associated rhomboid family serine protease
MLAQVFAAGQVRFGFLVAVFYSFSPLCLQIEREMGSAAFIITYMAAGIFGCV